MLDAHPELAIPLETHFIPQLTQECALASDPSDAFFDALERHFTWPDHHLEIESLRARAGGAAFDITNAFRAFYRSYAERFGKERWGDKTPAYLNQMTAIEAVLPESHFIHIIRDGRDISLSIADLWFGPHSGHKTAEEVAHWWAARLQEGQREGSKVKNYMEVRFEDLVLDSDQTLRRIADFIELRWDPSMLDYYRTAPERMAELRSTRTAAGGEISAEARRQIHELTARPPLPDRVGRWKTEMKPRDQEAFLEVAGDLLAELGYE